MNENILREFAQGFLVSNNIEGVNGILLDNKYFEWIYRFALTRNAIEVF